MNTKSNRLPWVLVAVLALVIVCGGSWLLFRGNQSQPDPSKTTASTDQGQWASEHPTSAPENGVKGESVKCPSLPEAASTEPITGAFGEGWKGKLDSLTDESDIYPVSENAGPAVVKTYPHCFQHSPKGALVAAGTFVSVVNQAAYPQQAMASYLADSGNNQAALETVAFSQTSTTAGSPLGFVQEIRSPDDAFVVIAYYGDFARVDAWPVHLKWDGNDWKVIAPENGNWGIRTLGTNGNHEGVLAKNGLYEWKTN